MSPCLLQGTPEHKRGLQATAVPNFPAPRMARPTALLDAEEVLTANAPVSPRCIPSPGPHRGEAGGAVTTLITPSSHFHHLPTAAPPFQPGAAGAGKGRAGAGRSVYIASRRGAGAAASPRDTERREAAALPPGLSSAPEVPTVSPRRAVLGGALPAVRSVRSARVWRKPAPGWKAQGWGPRGSSPEVSPGAEVRLDRRSQS